MIVLSCDTSTSVMHLALCRYEGGELVWFESLSLSCGNRHSELLMDRIIALCGDCAIEVREIDLLVTSAGPGSFTGLRIAMATLKGISLAASIPLVSVPTLDVWYQCIGFVPSAVLVVIDAKKGRFYTGLYHNGRRLAGPLDLCAEKIKALTAGYDDLLITGSDAQLLCTRIGDLGTVVNSEGSGFALNLAALGLKQYLSQGADAHDAGPLYIRVSDAEEALLETTRLKEKRDD